MDTATILNARGFTKVLSSIDTWPKLKRAVEANHAIMTPIHVAACIARLPYVIQPIRGGRGGGHGAAGGHVDAARASTPGMGMRLASLQDPEVITFVDALLEEFDTSLEEQAPWGLATCVWTLGKLGYFDRGELLARVLRKVCMRSEEFAP